MRHSLDIVVEPEDCTNCTGGAYSLFDDEGDEREYRCEHCGGTGKDPCRTATPPPGEDQ